MAKGTLVSREASAAMLSIFRQQHYNTMLTHDFPQMCIRDRPYFPSNRSALAMMLWEDAGKPMPESEPVSYTHLDVYKRQAQDLEN